MQIEWKDVMYPRNIYLAFLMIPLHIILAGCNGNSPSETPQAIEVQDFVNCVVKINGEALTDGSFSMNSGDSLKVEVELTYREGVNHSRIMAGMLKLVEPADNERGEAPLAHQPMQIVDTNQEAKTVHMSATWQPEVESGTYEMRLLSGLWPESMDADRAPMIPVFTSVVEVNEN